MQLIVVGDVGVLYVFRFRPFFNYESVFHTPALGSQLFTVSKMQWSDGIHNSMNWGGSCYQALNDHHTSPFLP